MKAWITCLGAAFLACSFCQAEMRIPSSIFTMEELEEAKQEAAEKEEPLIFVYTDPGTS